MNLIYHYYFQKIFFFDRVNRCRNFFIFFYFFLFLRIFNFTKMGNNKQFFFKSNKMFSFLYKKTKAFIFFHYIFSYVFFFLLFKKYGWLVNFDLVANQKLTILNIFGSSVQNIFFNIFIFFLLNVNKNKFLFYFKSGANERLSLKKSKKEFKEKTISYILISKRWNLFWFVVFVIFKNLRHKDFFYKMFFILINIIFRQFSIFELLRINLMHNVK